MSEEPLYCRLCHAPLTIQEKMNYGGSRCEDCWSVNMHKSVQVVPIIPLRKGRDHNAGHKPETSVPVVPME